MKTASMFASALLVAAAAALPLNEIVERDAQTSDTCPHYTIINTRATSAVQGPCTAFENMNNIILSNLTGGATHNTIYPASPDQKSWIGSHHIVGFIHHTLKQSPKECFILQGYSQGAAATTNALKNITGVGFHAVKGVLLFGNPNHESGLACNVDATGGNSTMDVNGSGIYAGGVPENWVSKTMDVCAFGDGVCDPPPTGWVVNAQHRIYQDSASVQAMGLQFILNQLS